jgi:microsomal prostaglandin-E synthase 2
MCPPIQPALTEVGPSIGPALAQICPFCNKIKALLDLHGLEYEMVDVNPLTKKEIKPW